MKILYLAHDDLSVPAAWQTHVREMLLALKSLGHSVSLFCPSPAPDWGIPVATYKRSRWNVFVGSRAELRAACESFRPDVIYLRGQHLSLLHRSFPVPFVLELNGFIEDELRGWRRWLYRRITAGHCRRAWKIVVITESMKQILIERYRVAPEKVIVISNAANPEAIRPLDCLECRRTLGLSSKDTVFVYISSFYPHHCHLPLVEAAREIGDIKFLFVGDGATRPAVIERVRQLGLQDRVLDVGRVPFDRVPLYLGAADVSLMLLQTPTDYERAPIKSFETMSAGRPLVLLTNNQAMVEFVRRHRIGYAFPWNGDPAGLVSSFRQVMADRKQWNECGTRGRTLIEEEFSWTHMARKLMAVLAQK